MLAKWLIARPAFLAFTVSAWMMAGLGLLCVFILTPLYDLANRVAALATLMQIAGGFFLMACVPAALVLLAGMLLYCLRCDHSPDTQRIAWIAAFLLTASLGAAVYFFRVYRPQRTVLLREEMLEFMERLVPAPEVAAAAPPVPEALSLPLEPER